MAQLLLIEDDDQLRTALTRTLTELGHAVTTAASAMPGLHSAVDATPDLIILDLGLPDVDGTETLRMLRGVSDVPVIVATARDDEGEIVRVLNAGADDYVTKPFTARQLDARVRAVLRRVPGNTGDDESITIASLWIDPRSREARLADRPLELTPKEFDLLHYLAANVGSVVSKRQLLTEVWGSPYGGADKTVDVHVAWLRRKLGETAQSPRYLRTVRGVGIKLVTPGSPEPEPDPTSGDLP
ncbi:response regulator transcription factor [Halostreptopolyspora alba]|uniref:DNA-binding response regulator n=1 Tax=Halostreptopolyspora alba TaxID=2487137 RepID=A0A3N0EDG9_9ACTN|nr:DNA-binding response regulator [Nocardiopsaceae bacterium YIM 96095]